MICLINFFIGLATSSSLISSNVFVLISACFYLFTLISIHNKIGMTNPMDTLFESLSIVGIIGCVIHSVLTFTGVKANEIYMIGLVLCLLTLYFLVMNFHQRFQAKNLVLLDGIEDSDLNLGSISSCSHFLSLVRDGFLTGHPILTTWKLNKFGILTWPENIFMHIIFAKLVAIYENESNELQSIMSELSRAKLKNISGKHLLIEIETLFGRREINYTSRVERQLKQADNSVKKAKERIHQIWELILQGQTMELERYIANALKIEQRTEKEYQGSLRTFPNAFMSFKHMPNSNSKSRLIVLPINK